MSSNADSIVAQIQQDMLSLMTYVTGPETATQTAYAVDDAVKLNLVHYLSRKYRQPAFRLHLHPLEGLSVPSA